MRGCVKQHLDSDLKGVETRNLQNGCAAKLSGKTKRHHLDAAAAKNS